MRDAASNVNKLLVPDTFIDASGTFIRNFILHLDTFILPVLQSFGDRPRDTPTGRVISKGSGPAARGPFPFDSSACQAALGRKMTFLASVGLSPENRSTEVN